jgi:hypothetical protein
VRRVDFSAPLPLGYTKAIERAVKLRLANPAAYTYPTLSAVMAEYHGFDRGPEWWRHNLQGLVPAQLHAGRVFKAAA